MWIFSQKLRVFLMTVEKKWVTFQNIQWYLTVWILSAKTPLPSEIMTSICSLLGVFTSCRLACAQVSSPDRFVCFWSNVNWKFVFGKLFFFRIVSWMQTSVRESLLFRLLEIWFACCFVHLNEKHNISILIFRNVDTDRISSYVFFMATFDFQFSWFVKALTFLMSSGPGLVSLPNGMSISTWLPNEQTATAPASQRRSASSRTHTASQVTWKLVFNYHTVQTCFLFVLFLSNFQRLTSILRQFQMM